MYKLIRNDEIIDFMQVELEDDVLLFIDKRNCVIGRLFLETCYIKFAYKNKGNIYFTIEKRI